MAIKEANPFESFLLYKSKTFPTRYLLNGILWHLKISQRDLQTSIILFQSRCAERSLIKTRLLNPAGRLLSSGDVRRGAQTASVCLTFIESVAFCRSGPSAVCASFQKLCAVECVQRDQALFFYQQLNASASCSFLVLRFTFVLLHHYDSLHAAARNNCSDSSVKFVIVPTEIPMLDKANSVCL